MQATANPPLPHGFKARSQRIAVEQRALLSLAPHEPMDPRRLAKHHGIAIRTPAGVPSLGDDERHELLHGNPTVWSAVSVTLPTGLLIIYNPTHDVGRINNSLFHELSHTILGHKHGQMLMVGDCVMREYDERQENEATWLAGSLLAPDAALKRAKTSGWTHAQTACHLGASEDVIRWRWGMSGIDRFIRPRSFSSAGRPGSSRGQ